ncbi:toprim domain-containing protein [Simplicispira metamorpha]|uniref:Putative DNA primase/helicase n=1 Tax=Simplicispira metamorpha TaxID=80881 RepID=A0A4R2NEA3_9BURK|nr:toprim domain-containing protein [Simplicispira metamorpha]TCP19547.1 putative DNA primase/helicase [Simplicispira metamorpha]
MNSVLDQFRAAIKAAGMEPPDTLHADGHLHRFSPTGKHADLAAWYVLHNDGLAAGVFGCWRSGLQSTWCAKPECDLTEAERSAQREQVRAAQRQRDAEQARRRQQASHTAMQRWQAAAPAIQHPYLAAKGVRAHGLRVEGAALLVPVRSAAGVLASLQTIRADGTKRFLPGGAVQGSYHAMGKLADVLVLAEGYATAATIHEAVGLPVAACFHSGNLLPVARALRRKYPALALLVAADDDWRTEGNPGLTAARHAALAVGGLVVVPQFPAERPAKATDFNDLAALAGQGAVRACFAELLEGTPC